jgi:hypothetical protein
MILSRSDTRYERLRWRYGTLCLPLHRRERPDPRPCGASERHLKADSAAPSEGGTPMLGLVVATAALFYGAIAAFIWRFLST